MSGRDQRGEDVSSKERRKRGRERTRRVVCSRSVEERAETREAGKGRLTFPRESTSQKDLSPGRLTRELLRSSLQVRRLKLRGRKEEEARSTFSFHLRRGRTSRSRSCSSSLRTTTSLLVCPSLGLEGSLRCVAAVGRRKRGWASRRLRTGDVGDSSLYFLSATEGKDWWVD